MRRRYRRRSGNGFRLELTPLIDVVFILLIFFAVSTTLQTHKKGLKLDLPSAVSRVKAPKSTVVSIDASGSVFVNNQRVKLSVLQRNLRNMFEARGAIPVVLQADHAVPYRVIIQVLDAIRLSGNEQVVLETRKVK